MNRTWRSWRSWEEFGYEIDIFSQKYRTTILTYLGTIGLLFFMYFYNWSYTFTKFSILLNLTVGIFIIFQIVQMLCKFTKFYGHKESDSNDNNPISKYGKYLLSFTMVKIIIFIYLGSLYVFQNTITTLYFILRKFLPIWRRTREYEEKIVSFNLSVKQIYKPSVIQRMINNFLASPSFPLPQNVATVIQSMMEISITPSSLRRAMDSIYFFLEKAYNINFKNNFEIAIFSKQNKLYIRPMISALTKNKIFLKSKLGMDIPVNTRNPLIGQYKYIYPTDEEVENEFTDHYNKYHKREPANVSSLSQLSFLESIVSETIGKLLWQSSFDVTSETSIDIINVLLESYLQDSNNYVQRLNEIDDTANIGNRMNRCNAKIQKNRLEMICQHIYIQLQEYIRPLFLKSCKTVNISNDITDIIYKYSNDTLEEFFKQVYSKPVGPTLSLPSSTFPRPPNLPPTNNRPFTYQPFNNNNLYNHDHDIIAPRRYREGRDQVYIGDDHKEYDNEREHKNNSENDNDDENNTNDTNEHKRESNAIDHHNPLLSLTTIPADQTLDGHEHEHDYLLQPMPKLGVD